jgi:hypothetical protein
MFEYEVMKSLLLLWQRLHVDWVVNKLHTSFHYLSVCLTGLLIEILLNMLCLKA